MKVPPERSMSVRASGPISTSTQPDQLSVGKHFDNDASSFETLLTDVSELSQSKDGLLPETLPLNPARLRELIMLIRTKVNYHLFSLMAEMNEHPSDHALPLGPMDLTPMLDELLPAVKPGRPFRPKPTTEGETEKPYEHIIERAARTYRVDPALIKAVIRAESDFDPDSASSKGAMGLMQLMPETAKELGVENPYDPFENIMGGTRYLKSLLKRYDEDMTLTLAAYNWGMGNVEKHPGGLPRETQTYIVRVHQYYREAKS